MPGILAITRRDPGPSHFQISGTRVSAIGNLLALVRLSYDLEASNVRLSPELADKWVTSELYEIDARAPGDSTPDLAQVRQMTQTLLADRFQLKVSRSSEVMPVYNLIVAPGGVRMKRSISTDPPLTRNDGSAGLHARVRCLNRSVADLVELVRRQFDRPILDKTGLIGGVDFTLDFEEHPPRDMPADVAAAMGVTGLEAGLPIAASLREQLGLTVVPAKEPVEILVIENAERPSAN
jgi:uncharacterized protein (TIGR03435 family)